MSWGCKKGSQITGYKMHIFESEIVGYKLLATRCISLIRNCWLHHVAGAKTMQPSIILVKLYCWHKIDEAKSNFAPMEDKLAFAHIKKVKNKVIER